MGLHNGIAQWDCTVGLHSGITHKRTGVLDRCITSVLAHQLLTIVSLSSIYKIYIYISTYKLNLKYWVQLVQIKKSKRLSLECNNAKLFEMLLCLIDIARVTSEPECGTLPGKGEGSHSASHVTLRIKTRNTPIIHTDTPLMTAERVAEHNGGSRNYDVW